MPDVAEHIKRQCGLQSTVVSGRFKDALDEAQCRPAYLLIYLHCPTHEDTPAFLSEVLPNPSLRELIESRFVLYAASVMEPEGYRLSLEFEATTFPFLAVTLRRETVLTVKGLCCARDLVKYFQAMFDRFDGVLAEEIHLRHEREERMRARTDDERHIAEMQAVDRKRIEEFEKKKRDKVMRLLLESEEMRRKLEEEEEECDRRQHEEMFIQTRSDIARTEAEMRLAPEPPADADVSTTTFISFRSLSGKQSKRRFYLSDRLSNLREYGKTLEDYDGCNFQLVVGHPPRALETESDRTIGDEPTLFPRAVVMMRRL
ncbi:hypothetical protein, conserved [Trypanosoma brucei gambiense DAL972]|uniref:UBX domain-containing protein n=1 Tax=Trypanosoma brucei gambiense (strain MHOM/CI/86/DAL972) TaxID=679716 RepID=C9ZZL9_TRYB9|nr:hypothetical protein, conserved [Trypanosoma brucei gambiense DAL972]CBH14868.1 hypothetical protein, conserved [Trypanosoma brucei gambiense DAL972]|eukprot:XP_011777134.1 hypothetical protein, conserved [Trypanosoma brucei gambiense DAL972]